MYFYQAVDKLSEKLNSELSKGAHCPPSATGDHKKAGLERVKNAAAHLKGTTDLISRFNAIDSNHLQGKIPLSFDVVSLYTNVNAKEAINTALEYTVKF